MNISWLFLALLAPFCFALVNKVDSHLVKKVSTTGALVIFSGFFGFFTALLSGIIALATGFSLGIGTIPTIAFIVSGALEVLWLIFYFKALETEEASSVVPWFQLIPLVIALLGFVFLGETLGLSEIIAGLFVIVGAIILSINWGESFHFKKRTAGLMLLTVVIISAGALLFKMFAIEEPSFWVSSFWMSLGMGILAAIFFIFKKAYRTEFLQLVRENTKTVLMFNIGNEGLNAVGLLSMFYAGLLVPLSYVHTVAAIQPLFVLLFDGVDAVRRKDWSFFSKTTMIPLIIAIIFMTIGAIIFEQAV